MDLYSFCDGPVEKQRHELLLLRFTGLDNGLTDSLWIDLIQYYVYGESAKIHYVRPWLLCGFPRAYETLYTTAFNRSNNCLRKSVEWSYKDFKQMFTSVDWDFKRSLKVKNYQSACCTCCLALFGIFRLACMVADRWVHYLIANLQVFKNI